MAAGGKKPATASRPRPSAPRKPPAGGKRQAVSKADPELLAAERDDLARELARAKRRIAALEKSRTQISEQIDSAIKSIHNVLQMDN